MRVASTFNAKMKSWLASLKKQRGIISQFYRDILWSTNIITTVLLTYEFVVFFIDLLGLCSFASGK